ncbi:ligand-binding sensor domain-containing protein [Dyadobacter sp. SG02]|uniref:hybrid sensor histidine kinase/response regulator transcription factor n=1 Tax=Dyadobacter sp. SG02 TaxID=1855291 RepID=UPI0008D69B60|nr:two-component regulator propeller domain-containing protein [Dyadobacter sp. SG02]SEJ39513.1 ligand-binding sensor domain-containing protein [Dyadobacter sp. SG02]
MGAVEKRIGEQHNKAVTKHFGVTHYANSMVRILVIWLCVLSDVFGQSAKLLTVENGLSSSMVTAVHQDRSGFIWVATEDGLNRFDGIKFTVYRQDKANGEGVASNFIQVLFEDRAGRMYTGSLHGLQYYDPATDSFRTIPLLNGGSKMANVRILAICERRNGDILVGTSGHGIFKVEHDGRQLCAKPTSLQVPSNLIIQLFEDSDRNLWVSTEDRGLLRFAETSLQPGKSYFVSKKIQNNIVTSLCQDKYGRVFVGNMTSGLYLYSAVNDTFQSIPNNGAGSLPIADLTVNRNGQILIGTRGNGLKYYDSGTGKILDMNHNVDTFDFAKSKVFSACEDNSGNTWLGIYQKGLLLMGVNSNRFGYMGYKSASKNLIGPSAVKALFEDKNQTIWVGTDNDGLYAIPAGRNASTHYYKRTGDASTPENVMTVFEDSEGSLWTGSYLSGLSKLDRETGKFTHSDKLSDQNGDNVQRVFDIKEDFRKRLWIATMGSGIFSMDLRTGAVENLDALPGRISLPKENFLPNSWVNCLLIAKDNKLFIGTFNGLACLDLETKSFTSTFGANSLLKGVVIYALFDDDKGNLWAGTSQGLKKIDRATKAITTFDTADGLPSNQVGTVRGDKAGNLWLSTNRGLSKMDLETHTFVNFYSADGLQGNEFSQGASVVTQDGEFYFGGINGLTHFKPEEIKLSAKRPAVRIVDLYIHDKAVKKGMKSGSYMIVDTTVSSAKEFNLAHYDNSFSLEFSTMDFIDAERVAYMYAINDNAWTVLRAGTNRLTFDNLAPGEYHFRLKAKSSKTDSEETRVTIIIHPAWYFSVWAWLAYGLLSLFTAVLIFRAFKNRQLVKQKMLAHLRREEVNEAKLQFFINIAHEIRTPLTLVVSPLEKLQSQDYNAERMHLYRIMGRNTKRILDLVNQLMDIRKIEKGLMSLQFSNVEMVEYTKEICLLFEEQIESKKIDFAVESPSQRILAQIDPLNFDKVLINVLSNAFKFTPRGGKIRVALSVNGAHEVMDRPELRLAIEDSGPFIEQQEAERIFDCFYQSDSHRDHNRHGTGIGLHLVKQLVELHGGRIKAENMTEIGCRFVIEMPVAEIGGLETVPVDEVSPADHLPEEMSVYGVHNKSRKKAKRVVVVDDDSEICNYLADEMSGEFTVFSYANGEEAYKAILKEIPDLIVSDVMMPVMDGMTLCKKVKANPLINHIPVILLTAKTAESTNAEGLEMGADAYITKPFNMQILTKTIKALIRNRQILRNNDNEQHYQEEFISRVHIKASEEKLLEKVHLLIDKNLANPDLSVEMISNEIGISRVHLHRKLKELTNMTTRDLIRNIRLKQAGELMTKKGLTVSEVAFAVGFANVNSFSVAFKELHGMSPTAFAENYMEKV